jgi:hypothetical protein
MDTVPIPGRTSCRMRGRKAIASNLLKLLAFGLQTSSIWCRSPNCVIRGYLEGSAWVGYEGIMALSDDVKAVLIAASWRGSAGLTMFQTF